MLMTALALVLGVPRGPAAAESRCSLRDPGPCLVPPARAGSATTPWLDEAIAPRWFEANAVDRTPDRRWASLAAVGGVYLAFSTWAYFAWYRNVDSLGSFQYGDADGYFGANTYAGGADKAGHVWANMVLGRGGSRVLRWGGWDAKTAGVLGSALAWGLFLGVEIKDGYYYKFSYGDAYANTAGALLAVLFELSPRADELFDFRVAYAPSPEYLGLWRGEYWGTKAGNSLNIAEDYSGQTYLLALHLGAIEWPAATPRPVAAALEYLDVGVAFATRRYKPDAPPDAAAPTQHLYLGIALDVQRVANRLLAPRSTTGRKVAHGVLEVLTPPYTILPVAGASRSATGPVGPQ